jgi:hypothetical protein
MGGTTNAHKALLLTAAVAITAWGVIGYLDRRQLGRAEFMYDLDYSLMVVPDGPAAQAGMQDGDRMVSVEGVMVEDLPLYSRWPRSLGARVGESRRYVVERDGELLTFDVVHGAAPRGVLHLQLGGALVGLSFLWFGMWALFAIGTAPAVTLSYVGLAAGFAALAHGPYLGTWDGVTVHVSAAAMVLWTALLAWFFLTFPTRKGAAERPLTPRIIFGLWLTVPLTAVLELLFHPALYHTFGPWLALLMLGYVILGLAALVHTALKTPRGRLWDSGMGWILVGLVVGFVPTLVGLIDWAFLRDFDIPGSSYYALMLAVIPVTLALAVRQQARAATVQ